MTTTEAFNELTSRRGWYKDLGIEKSTAGSLAKRVRDGEKISQDKIEEILVKAGYKVEMEKQWSKVTSGIEKLVDIPEHCFGQDEWFQLHAHMLEGKTFIEKVKMLDIYQQKKAAMDARPKSIVEKLLEVQS